MANYAELAHQELIAALDAFNAPQDNNYQGTINHAMHAVHLFLHLLSPHLTQPTLESQLKECLTQSDVQADNELVSMLTNLQHYEGHLHQPQAHDRSSQEALQVLWLCNNILSHSIKLVKT